MLYALCTIQMLYSNLRSTLTAICTSEATDTLVVQPTGAVYDLWYLSPIIKRPVMSHTLYPRIAHDYVAIIACSILRERTGDMTSPKS